MTANAAMPEQFSPIRLLVTLLVLIFCIEGAMMFALDDLLPKGTPVWVGAAIDAGLLTAITSAFVWRLFIRPLRFALLSEAAQGKAITDTAAEGRIRLFKHETYVCVDSVHDDLVVFDLGLQILDVYRLDSLQGLSRASDRSRCRILPTLVGLGNHFDHFKHVCHGKLLGYDCY